jgi:two-component system sensor histidine kinase BaeS
MVADIAHELRTPISVMQGALEAMLDGILSPDREELRSLHDETLHLARLVADLRTLSLADAGQLALEFQEIDVGELVEDVAKRMEVMADEKGIKLRTRISGSLPIQADAQRLTQVFTNLLANALQYTPQGGEISAAVNRRDGHVQVTVASSTGSGAATRAEIGPVVALGLVWLSCASSWRHIRAVFMWNRSLGSAQPSLLPCRLVDKASTCSYQSVSRYK